MDLTRQKGLQSNCALMLSKHQLVFLAGNSKVVDQEQELQGSFVNCAGEKTCRKAHSSMCGLFGHKSQNYTDCHIYPPQMLELNYLDWTLVFCKTKWTLDDPFPKKIGTIGFLLGDGIKCLQPEAQNSALSLEVAKIQFSISVLYA